MPPSAFVTKIIRRAPQIQFGISFRGEHLLPTAKGYLNGVEPLFLRPGFKIIMTKSDDPKRAIMHSIADALGVPVEQFYGGDPALKTSAGEDDCLRLWCKIGSDKGRAQALKALQAIADEEAI